MRVRSIIVSGIVAGSGVLVLAGGQAARGAILGPYAADADTLHLYHLDDAAAPMTDSGTAATLRPLDVVTATVGQTSFSGFSSALGFNGTSAQAKNSAATFQAEWQGASGAFTYEALIDSANIGTTSGVQTILSRDHTSGGPNQRSLIFRLNNANLEFINTGQGSNQTITVPLPTTGADAIANNTWFHVAVAYNGSAATPGNTSFYWTKVDPSATQADLLGTGQLNFNVGDVGGTGTFFDVGQRDNQTASGGFNGLIDEVRVSDIARTASQFIFATSVPEPGSVALIAAAGLLFCGRRRQRSA